MRKCLFLVFFFIVFFFEASSSQSIRGAEFIKHTTVDQELVIQLKVYRENDSKDTITIDWGDGQKEPVPLAYFDIGPSGYRVDTYGAIHPYDTAGYYELVYTDSFLIANVVNIENSGQKTISLRDSVLIFDEDHPFSGNYMPEFLPTQFAIDFEENGTVTHWAFFVPNDIGMPDQHLLSLVPFPSEGYTPAEATNSVHMDNALLVWDRPVSPGTYAFCIKVKEMREDFFDEFPEDSILMSTTHRAMMIDVDSSMLVSSFSPWVEGVVSVFPNPARERITIQLAAFDRDPTVTIFSLNGQKMFIEKVSASSQLKTIDVQVDDWPRGLYSVQIEASDQIVVRKIVVQWLPFENDRRHLSLNLHLSLHFLKTQV